MYVSKLRAVTALLLGVALLGVGVAGGGLAYRGQASEFGRGQAQPREAARKERPQPKPPEPATGGRLLVWRDTKYVLVGPDGKDAGELPGHPDKRILSQPVLSPDGKRAAFVADENPPTDEDGNRRRHVFVRDTDGKGDGFTIAVNAAHVAWAPDGKGLVVSEFLPAKEMKDMGFVTWLVDVATKEKTNLDLSRQAQVFGLTPDGKAFVAAVYDLKARKAHLALVSRDGKTVTELTEVRTEGPDPKVSPDGARLLFQDYDPADKPEKDVPPLPRLFVYDLAAKKRQRLADMPLNAWLLGYCWSPDGKRLAYTWKQVHPGVPLVQNTDNMNDPKLDTETESHLVVADADGTNAKTVMSAKAKRATTITLEGVDWR